MWGCHALLIFQTAFFYQRGFWNLRRESLAPPSCLSRQVSQRLCWETVSRSPIYSHHWKYCEPRLVFGTENITWGGKKHILYIYMRYRINSDCVAKCGKWRWEGLTPTTIDTTVIKQEPYRAADSKICYQAPCCICAVMWDSWFPHGPPTQKEKIGALSLIQAMQHRRWCSLPPFVLRNLSAANSPGVCPSPHRVSHDHLGKAV